MPFSPENVTLAGSQLVFHNTYAGTVTTAYHNAILTAEHAFESQFSDPVTISVSFDFANLGAGFLAQNQFNNTASVSYSALRTALINNATPGDADDQHAVALLQAQANDPTVGLPSATGNNLVTAHNYLIGGGMARLLGLGGAQGPNPDVQLVLGTGVTWDFDPSNGISSGAFDAVGAIEHEISEGGFGRVAGVGVQNHAWGPLDLFRYSSPGHRDVTGGKDGVSTFFSVDGNTMLTPFHNSVNTAGTFDGQDFGDWNIGGDSFGFGKPGTIGALSAVDLQVLDILGWTRIGSTPPTTDDFRDSLNDTTAPLGQLSFNGQGTATSTGNLEVAGDRDCSVFIWSAAPATSSI